MVWRALAREYRWNSCFAPSERVFLQSPDGDGLYPASIRTAVSVQQSSDDVDAVAMDLQAPLSQADIGFLLRFGLDKAFLVGMPSFLVVWGSMYLLSLVHQNQTPFPSKT